MHNFETAALNVNILWHIMVFCPFIGQFSLNNEIFRFCDIWWSGSPVMLRLCLNSLAPKFVNKGEKDFMNHPLPPPFPKKVAEYLVGLSRSTYYFLSTISKEYDTEMYCGKGNLIFCSMGLTNPKFDKSK